MPRDFQKLPMTFFDPSNVLTLLKVAQFRYIKIQLKTIDITTRLGGMI